MKDNKLSSKDWELISAYLDNELNPRDKARVEERLKTRPEYKEALDGLHRTKVILQKAPVRKVPRNFTLTAADVQPVKVARWIPAMQWSSVAVALVAVFLFAYQLVPGFISPQPGATPDLAVLEAPMEMAAAESTAADTPEIIYWGGPPLPEGEIYGKGGGGSGIDCSQPGVMCGGGAESMPIGGGGDGVPPLEMPFPQPPIPNTLPDLQADSDARATAAATEPVTGTGPVLGVRPETEQGEKLTEPAELLAVEREVEQESERQTRGWILGAAGALLAAGIGLFIAATIARRKSLS